MRAFGTASRTVASALILCLVSGCATGHSARLRLHGDVSTTRCEAPKTSEHLLPVVNNHSSPDQGDGTLVELSPAAEQTAATIRVLGLVKRLPRLEQEAQVEPGAIWRLLWTRQQIVDRISLAAFDVSSTVAEIDCEESRADHVADGMQEVRQDRQEQGLFLALIGGALIGVVAGSLSLAAQATASAASAILVARCPSVSEEPPRCFWAASTTFSIRAITCGIFATRPRSRPCFRPRSGVISMVPLGLYPGRPCGMHY